MSFGAGRTPSLGHKTIGSQPAHQTEKEGHKPVDGQVPLQGHLNWTASSAEVLAQALKSKVCLNQDTLTKGVRQSGVVNGEMSSRQGDRQLNNITCWVRCPRSTKFSTKYYSCEPSRRRNRVDS